MYDNLLSVEQSVRFLGFNPCNNVLRLLHKHSVPTTLVQDLGDGDDGFGASIDATAEQTLRSGIVSGSCKLGAKLDALPSPFHARNWDEAVHLLQEGHERQIDDF